MGGVGHVAGVGTCGKSEACVKGWSMWQGVGTCGKGYITGFGHVAGCMS